MQKLPFKEQAEAGSVKTSNFGNSKLNNRCQELVPNEEIIRMFVEMGGYLITMGSDAHTPDRIDLCAEKVTDVLKRYGLKNLFYFENRCVCSYSIEQRNECKEGNV